ncbi:MAG: translation initiation factor IF-3 [Candidatus Yanofskybacteria bacterium RIFCSPLOWO2_02_FULL_43_10]|uniref:Translation initiation factor IF-3 n=1 Tax=Candidatus Yanofskybacteria bacterium RIFCSPLOWO2_12_FULL_43_11b TaxID=1802710 RepID=A0A1F8H8C4_9BACT|nr:MAG: translation initiation factor IF-3 [Candidatus Yanofskybacteria bacterium RIFCSPHIGHO2_01_FULL_43_32]OGN11870.1 MAG: translation initiation factor IF-3 [Candidatus Yanofskybacteria bacterium RIFCSPHIGHO2_02_FULL_43_12]OGN18081.1 MAG: translation initiation factor IF-3 [Candidatus Yanofskybacteria bacterium RIFCSPHIGHO2_12_FULL_43_11]OGN25332.1 MAG: translation initiation factor IF-3 [Candidatus Yanofskybacteria bacterium RIFCSPLOWO2_01_FULL_43_46]OGN28616.1 MAG: translation initiation f
MLKRLRINNQIKAVEVQVIDEAGKQLGTMKTFDALKLAREKELDLAEVGPNAQPPIAKIMDYGKYIYRKERQDKKSGPKQKEQERKTVRVGFKTGTHDLEFKAKQVGGFLKEGHIVKIELTLRGREKALAHLGKERLNTFIKFITEEFTVQDNVKRSPFGWTITIKK